MEEQNYYREEVAVTTISDFLSGAAENAVWMASAARWILKILILLVPVFFLPFTFDILELNKQALMVVAVSLSAILWLGQGIMRGKLQILTPVKPISSISLIGLIAAVGVLASVFSLQPDRSIFGAGGYLSNSLISLLSFAFFFFLTVNLFEKSEVKGLLRFFSIGILAAILISLLNLYGLPVIPFEFAKNAGFNTVGSLNSLGLLAALGIIIAISNKTKSNLLSNIVNYAVTAAGLFLLIILNFWILWVILILGLIAAIVFSALNGMYRLKDLILPIGIIAIAVLMLATGARVRTAAALPVEVSLSFRASFNIAKDAVLGKPVFGFGPENFGLAFDKFKPQGINSTVFWNTRFSDAASEFFNGFVMNGLVGGILMVVFAVWILMTVLFRAKNRDASLAAPAAISAIAAFFLYPMNMSLSLAFWLVAGLLIIESRADEGDMTNKTVSLEDSPLMSVLASVAFVAVLVLSIGGIYFIQKKFRADIKFARASQTQDSEKATQALVDAININPREDIYSRALSDLLLNRASSELAKQREPAFAKASQDAKNASNTRLQNFVTAAVEVSNNAVARHPQDASNWFNRGFVLQNLMTLLQGADNQALASYDEYIKLSPFDPLGPTRKGTIYFNRADLLQALLRQGSGGQAGSLKPEERTKIQKQIQEDIILAEENFKKAIEIKSDFALANYNLGAVYERQGKIVEAVKQLENVRTLTPQDAGLAFQLGLLYYRNNQKDSALNEILRAVAISPDFSNARWYLALMLEEKGKIDEAIAVLNRVQELNPDNQDVAKKISDLQAGKREFPPGKVTGKEPLEEERGKNN